MKKGVFAVILGTLLAGSMSLTAYVPKPAAGEQQNFQLMFIQTAEQAIVRQNPRNPQKWTLILKNVDPAVAYYSESPKKIAGKVTVADFLDEWSPSTRNSPSGALVTQFSHSNAVSDGATNNRQIVLSNPRYDKRTQTLTYDAENLTGSSSLTEGKHSDPVLFIEKFN